MADSPHGSFLLRPRFLLFCMYIMLYITIRSTGEIAFQNVPVQGSGQQYIVGPDFGIPRWRRQLYRVFLSPAMVAEEEGRRLLARGEGLVQGAGSYGRSLIPGG